MKPVSTGHCHTAQLEIFCRHIQSCLLLGEQFRKGEKNGNQQILLTNPSKFNLYLPLLWSFWDSSQADVIPSDLSPRALCPDKWHSTAHTCVILFSLCEVVRHLRVKTHLMHLSFFLPPVTPKLLTSTQSFEGSTEATDTFSVSEHSPLYTFVLNQSLPPLSLTANISQSHRVFLLLHLF